MSDFQKQIDETTRRNNPQTLDDIKFAWKLDADAISGKGDPRIALELIPRLHAKYRDLMNRYVVEARKAFGEYSKLRKSKYAYYRGDMNSDPEELKRRNWEPNRKKIDATQIKEYLEGDDDLVEAKIKYEETTETAEYLKDIITFVKDQRYALNSKIKYSMFLHDGTV